MTSTISALKALASERRDKNQTIYTQLESIARVQSVKSSNAIEGIVTTDARIKEIVNGNSAPLNHNEMEIAGYRDVLDIDDNDRTITYQSGDNVWRIFTEEACSDPLLLKQDDSYYEAYRICAQESLDDFLYTYSMFYNVGDYAGICALSKGLEYSDEQQIEWEKQNIRLTQTEVEEGKSEDEKKVKSVFQFADSEKILYLHLVRENNNWYVNGLPQ